MDKVFKYLAGWEGHEKAANRLSILVKTHNLLRQDGRLKEWRFVPGKRRKGDRNPMYCAFAVTPFSGDDYFILRLVKRQSDKFSIGFCPDYGKQDSKQGEIKPFRKRRKNIEKAIVKIQNTNPQILEKVSFSVADAKGRPHAYKGFERKIVKPETAEDLAEEFIITVLEWKRLFERII
ncbi:hypothetical protein MWH25_10970 [Natroniella acetigena]|uniref:hypothetical protein n=1 Tax=Natroniella acetigena TaxID=52004 RepID=UPI00200A35AE|nr:hypothetical protein [Natroniella acetigena]MCK8828254.1 hypothetical protein [Natroniella acetigena]